jgi:hypothetical protein
VLDIFLNSGKMRYDDPVVTTANGGLGHGQEHLGKSSNLLWMEEILHQ